MTGLKAGHFILKGSPLQDLYKLLGWIEEALAYPFAVMLYSFLP